ncbi:ESX secretion-associated protein EspG [Nocardia sp. BMG51109]|uniref:ESX secretion-associated protein EspG n=1 Tax=Nocardia sp. BMG51109 TaxID=1056816 RepID=UPI000463FB2A|nr:ESX secretion-associated protein EspG [Nocardia sp. BMG51109]
MSRRWRFSDVELVGLWESEREGALPWPFAALARIPYYDDYEQAKHEARARIRADFGPVIHDVITALSRPDIRIAVFGWDDRDRGNPEAMVRLLGVRAAGAGFVVKQLPGESIWHSGGYVVIECTAVDLARTAIGELPHAEPGTVEEIVLPTYGGRDDVDYEYRRSVVSEPPIHHRSEEFLRRPTSLIGRIDIVQGRSRFGPRGITHHKLEWRDVIDDGRYSITTDNGDPIATPVDADRFAAVINSRVAQVVRVIKDEHA